MLKASRIRGFLAIGALLGLQAVPTTTAQAATPAECVDFSIRVCTANWDALGYSSYGECRLDEYAKCMNGDTSDGDPLTDASRSYKRPGAPEAPAFA